MRISDWSSDVCSSDLVSSEDIEQLLSAAQRDWSQIDPSILGTLFERGLDPAKRSQLGAHYTDRDKIMMIVRPVIIEPLEAERSEEHTSEFQSLMRISYAVFCLKKKNNNNSNNRHNTE